MKFALIGSRKIEDIELVEDALQNALELHAHPDSAIVIISGGAVGVDACAESIAKARGYDFVVFKPLDKVEVGIPYDVRFLHTRNKQIVDNADVVVAVWDGKSPGTKRVIDYCKKINKPYTLTT
jgi:uncharacterized phage-like protein YoqJ